MLTKTNVIKTITKFPDHFSIDGQKKSQTTAYLPHFKKISEITLKKIKFYVYLKKNKT